jgi:hypothetical protein
VNLFLTVILFFLIILFLQFNLENDEVVDDEDDDEGNVTGSASLATKAAQGMSRILICRKYCLFFVFVND